jgi:D-aminopeptidase
VRAAVGNIEGAEVKNNLGFHSASTLTPQAAQELIGTKVKAALGRLKEFKAYTVTSPVTLDVSFKHYLPSEVLSYLRGVERLDAHSIRFRAKDMLEASDFMQVVTRYSPSLEP